MQPILIGLVIGEGDRPVEVVMRLARRDMPTVDPATGQLLYPLPPGVRGGLSVCGDRLSDRDNRPGHRQAAEE